MVLAHKEIIGRGETERRADPRGDRGDQCRCTGYQQIVSAVPPDAAAGDPGRASPAVRPKPTAQDETAIATPSRAPSRWLGKPMKRVEDPRLLLGHGGYVEDIELAGMLARRDGAQPARARAHRLVDTSPPRRCPASYGPHRRGLRRTGPCANFGPGTIAQYPIAIEKVRH